MTCYLSMDQFQNGGKSIFTVNLQCIVKSNTKETTVVKLHLPLHFSRLLYMSDINVIMADEVNSSSHS